MKASKIAFIVEGFMSEVSIDVVGLWQIAKQVEKEMGKCDEAREQTLAIVRHLLERGFQAGGSPHQIGGYVPWPNQNAASVVELI